MIREVSIKVKSEIDREIKLFLSNLYIRYNLVYGVLLQMVKNILIQINCLPYWLTKHDGICLLNLPKVVQVYGPLIDLWEIIYERGVIFKICKNKNYGHSSQKLTS